MTSKALATWEVFNAELTAPDRLAELQTMLPSSISLEFFKNCTIAAIKQNPELLLLNRRSLHKAITQAAREGLMPDGREGVIIIQNEKVKGKNGEKDTWIKTARFQSMVYGIRKRARETDGLVIDAQIVYDADHFDWEQGDNAYITHKPLLPWKGKRGPMVAAFAIFRQVLPSGQIIILHREVMDAEQIAAVRGASKQPNSLMWTSFPEEGWKKSVVRRGIKSVPCSPALRTIFDNHDDDFEFAEPRIKRMQATPAATPLPMPEIEGEVVDGLEMPPDTIEDGPAPDPVTALLSKIDAALSEATDLSQLHELWALYDGEVERMAKAPRDQAFALYDRHEARVSGKAKQAKKAKARAA